MVAIVSGLGLGLFSSSINTQGGSSVGPGSPGRNGEKIVVNAATGNLVIQNQDERLTALGLDAALLRTYNARGAIDGDNNDGWRISVYQRLFNLPATRNAAGSLTKTFGDGAEVTYTWNAARSRYESTTGEGAHDFITWNATTAQWTWTEGTSLLSETYDTNGRLLSARDTDGNTLTYGYTGNLITQITTATGAGSTNQLTQTVYLDYTGNNLTRIRTVETANGVSTTQTLTRYRYDASNRLIQVVLDLSPADNTVSTPDANGDGLVETVNGQSYVTTYTYVGATTQIASITQSDGSSVSFGYITQDGQSRLSTYDVFDGTTTRRTSFAYAIYSATAGIYQTVDVTDPTGRITRYSHDTSGRLISVLSPTVNGVRLETRYGYDAATGDLLTVTEDAGGINRTTTHRYDAAGNITLTYDSAGNTIARTFSTTNQLLTETVFLARNPTSAAQPSPLTTRYVYDAEEHLRFVVSPEGRVTEHRYNTNGTRSLTLRYTGATYNVAGLAASTVNTAATLMEGQLQSWVATQDLTKLERLDYGYDFRGNLLTTTAWGATDAAGVGIAATRTLTQFVYDQRGQLLQTIEPRGSGTTPNPANANLSYATTYTYDGLGRVLTTTEWIAPNGTTPVVRTTSSQYDDVGNRTLTTAANGLLTTSTYNRAGELTSLVGSATGMTSATTSYKYDANGRLRITIDPNGFRTFLFYDEAGRKIAEVDADGSLTEITYNRAGDVVKTTRYATALTTTTIATFTDAGGNPREVALSAFRPSPDDRDQIAYAVYNTAGQLIYTVDAENAVTETVYDGAGRVTGTIAYATRLGLTTQAAELRLTATPGQLLDPGTGVVYSITADAADRRTRTFYTNDGQIAGTLDAAGYLSEVSYNAAGYAAQAVSYANPTNASLRASGTLDQLRASVARDTDMASDAERDAIAYFFYDGQGRKVGELDAEGYLTEWVYDIAGNVTETTRYDRALSAWRNEGVTGYLASTQVSGTVALYRLYLPSTGDYFYTANATERTSAISGGWSDQGVAGYIYSTQASGTTALYRLRNATRTEHVYTTSAAERAGFLANGYVDEGVAGYVATTQASGTNALYRLGNTTTGFYLLTTSASELASTVSTFASLKTAASGAPARTERFQYDGLGRLTQQTNAESVITQYVYDAIGNLTSKTVAAGTTEARTTQAKYDALGRVTRELSGEGSKALAALGATPTAAAIDQVWNRYGVFYTYDAAGRRLSVTTRAFDSAANTEQTSVTYFYYDNDGRVRFTVDGAGGVRENFYDALDQLSWYIAYANPIATAGLTGGLVTTALTDRLAGDVGGSRDVGEYYQYTRRGEVTLRMSNTNDAGHAFEYNAFGEMSLEATINATTQVQHNYTRNQRGEITGITTSQVWNTATPSTSESKQYDAFGRLKSYTDPRGNTERFEYDRLGRMLVGIDQAGGRHVSTYDAFSRVLTTRDALYSATNNTTTTYVYNDTNRSVTVTTPEGVSVTTVHNRHGENVSVTANGRVTTYEYNANGAVTNIYDQAGTVELRTYDSSGRQVSTKDARGTVTKLEYDAASRVIKRTVDPRTLVSTNDNPNGLNLVTSYQYDAQGRVLRVIEPGGRTTVTQYDAEGRVLEVAVDPSGLNRRTRYAYGNLAVSVTEGYGSPVGRTTEYRYDHLGRRISEIKDVGGLNLTTEYKYDQNGNVTRTIEAAGTTNARSTWNVYDAKNRLAYTIDAQGGLTGFTYDAEDRLIATRTYANALATAALRDVVTVTSSGSTLTFQSPGQTAVTFSTTNFYRLNQTVYDKDGRVVFTVGANGEVVEFAYNPNTSNPNNQTQVIRTKKYVTTRLNVFTTAAEVRDALGIYANTNLPGDDVGFSVYDARGRLAFAINGVGGVTQYQYDGNDNLIQTTRFVNTRAITLPMDLAALNSWLSNADPLRPGVSGATIANNAGNEVTRFAYDRANRLRIATDATGIRTFRFYDALGRETATVDGDGTLTETLYNRLDQVVKVTRFADRLSTATLATLVDGSGNPTGVSVATLKAALPATVGRAYDQITRNIYDSTGRLLYRLDSSGDTSNPGDSSATEYVYDTAGRLIANVQYAGRVYYDPSLVEIRLPDIASGPLSYASSDDRRTRFFYDERDNLVATLDAEGYLTEHTYDSLNQRTTTIAYANATATSNATKPNLRLTGTLAELRPALDNETSTDPEQDARTFFFYDVNGDLVGTLDPEGYVTVNTYDNMGRLLNTLRYGRHNAMGEDLGGLVYVAGETMANLISRIPTAAVRRSTSYVYDGVGRLVGETNVEGTMSNYDYDNASQRTGTRLAVNTTDARTTVVRYDALGRVSQELTAEGASKLVTGMTTDQVNTIWAQYGIKHDYDSAGRRIRTTDQNGFLTLYFYDQDNRLRYEVRQADVAGTQGEVTENRYDAFGQLSERIAYSGRVSLSGLTPGLVAGTLSRVDAIADAAHDARTAYTYTTGGRLEASATTGGTQVFYQYNAFGEIEVSLRADATSQKAEVNTRDHRGLVTERLTGAIWGAKVSETLTYDAFGRITTVTDPRGNRSRSEYDRLGRVIATVDRAGARRVTTYDAFDRVLTTRDALYSGTNNTTTKYTYDDTKRNVIVTTPEGISVTTVHNRHGQTLSVNAAGNTTTYTYNENGQVKTISDGLGAIESRLYDRAGRLVTTSDTRGTVTRLEYDAANRVLARTVDPKTLVSTNDNPNGLNLRTEYQYDGQGRVIRVTEPSGRRTDTEYDQDGRAIIVRVDPQGLNLITRYQYDPSTLTLTVTEGDGPQARRTQYLYDNFGRRIEEIVDPTSLGGTLDIHTQYVYDNNGNLARKIEAAGTAIARSTWYVYDKENRVIQTINALGEVTHTAYDAEGRVLSERQSGARVDTASLGDVLDRPLIVPEYYDRFDQTVYDKDGRAVYAISPVGTVTEFTPDAAGRTTRTRTYGTPITVSTATPLTTVAAVKAALAARTIPATDPTDRYTYTAYDVRGRTAFEVDGTGAVTQYQYDLNDNVLAATRFVNRRTLTQSMDYQPLLEWVGSADPLRPSVSGATIGNNPSNQTTRYWYDKADRACFTLDPEGFVRETRYNDAARETRQIIYNRFDANGLPVKPTIAATATLAEVAAAVGAIAAQDQVTVTTTDMAGRVSRVTDGEGYRTDYVYDQLGNRLETRVALDLAATDIAVTRHYYDVAGRERYTLDAERYLTETQYDALGNVTARILYDQQALVPTPGSNPVPASSAARITRYRYDAAGRLTRETQELLTYARTAATYTVQAGATWESIATTAYGTPLVAEELAAALGYVSTPAPEQISFNMPAVNTVLTLPATLIDVVRTEYLYDTRGNMTHKLEAAGSRDLRVTKYDYDYADQVYQTTEAFGTADAFVVSFYRDAFGNVRQRSEAYGTVDVRYFNFDYDAEDRVTRETDALRRVTTHQYDAFGNEQLRNTAFGTSEMRTVVYQYDRRNQLLYSFNYLTGARYEQYGYDAVGNRISVTDANGYYLAYADHLTGSDNYYRDWRRRLGIDKAAASLTPAERQLVMERGTVRYTYNRANRLVTVRDARQTETRYTYDGTGNKRTMVEAYGTTDQRTTAYSYYKNGRLFSITDPEAVARTLGPTTSYTYDVLGNVATETQANGSVRTNVYDRLGQLTTSTVTGNGLANGGLRTTFAYDRRGNNVSSTQSFGDGTDARTTTYQYDLRNRKTRVTDAEGFSTTIVYDRFGNQKSITVGQYLVPTNDAAYNAINAARSTVLTSTFVYDAGDRMLSMTDGAGNVTLYGYNNYDWRTSMAEGNATAAATSDAPIYQALRASFGAQFNKSASQLTAADRQSIIARLSTVYTYDELGRVISEKTPAGGITNYAYDRGGNKVMEQQLQSYSYTVPATTTWTDLAQILYGNYSVAPQLKALPTMPWTATDTVAAGTVLANLPASFTVDVLTHPVRSPATPIWMTKRFEYNENGQVTVETDSYNTRTEIFHDKRGNVIEQRFAAGTSDERRVGMRYDLNDRKIADIDAIGMGLADTDAPELVQLRREMGYVDGSGNGKSWTALTATERNTLRGHYTTQYVYDKAGNRTKVIDAMGKVARYYYNGANQLTAVLDPEGYINTFKYDANGNRIEERVSATRFTGTPSDATVPVVSTSVFDRMTRYGYDGANQLRFRELRETVLTAPRVTRTDFVYDGAGHKLAEFTYAQTATYRLPSGQTWPQAAAQVAAALYGIGTSAAGTALQTALGSQTAPDLINLPVSLTVNGRVYFLNTGATTGPRVQRYTYDAAGRVSTYTEEDGKRVTFTYDASNNRVLEAITHTNANDPVTARQTLYTYDLNNRRVSEQFLSSVMNGISSRRMTYDLAGNLLLTAINAGVEVGSQSVDRVVASTYDLNNRELTHTERAGNYTAAVTTFGNLTNMATTPITTTYTYDLVGNLTSKTDPNGNVAGATQATKDAYTTRYTYDRNNRRLQEILPSVRVHDWALGEGGARLINPTTSNIYDAVGNLVQVIDAAGYKTTRYYDGNRHLVAELRADNSLIEHTYNAFGEMAQKIEYMTLITTNLHRPNQRANDNNRPVGVSGPVGSTRTTVYTYDYAGRLTSVLYPVIEVTTLTNVGNNEPTVSRITGSPTETHTFDAYGNEYETIDRAGARTLSFFDVKGRRIAAIDAAGFYTQWDYDAQGNKVAERRYDRPFPLTAIPAYGNGTPPAPVAGSIAYLTTWVYDGASRLIAEFTPAVDTYSIDVNGASRSYSGARMKTEYEYDNSGNLIAKRSGIVTQGITVDRANEVVEYYHYDAANRLIATIDNAKRVLTVYTRDANGNVLIETRRFIELPLANIKSANESNARALLDQYVTYVTDKPGYFSSNLMSKNPNDFVYQDQVKTFEYDARNLLTREIDLMQVFDFQAAEPRAQLALYSFDDRGRSYRYDAVGNRNSILPEEGSTSMVIYDGMRRVRESYVSGAGWTNFVYDAAGNPILTYVGRQAAGSAAPATNVGVTFTNGLNVSYDITGTDLASWVVWDTSSRNDIFRYVYRSNDRIGSNTRLSASLADIPAGTQVFFRVMTRNQETGATSWTAEQTVTVPPRYRDINIATTATSATVRVRFEGNVVNPRLYYGTPGTSFSTSLAFGAADANGWRTVTVSGITPGNLAYQIRWQDGSSVSYTSPEGRFNNGDVAIANLPLTVLARASSSSLGAGSGDADGRVTGYYTESTFNALNQKIATNEGDGLYREFGVDGNGNVWVTRLYGKKTGDYGRQTGAAITTYTAFDGLGRKIADFSAPVPDNFGVTRRMITRYTYNAHGKVETQGKVYGYNGATWTANYELIENYRYVYNGAGWLIQEINPLNQTTQHYYDHAGRETQTMTPLQNRSYKVYDLEGQLVREIDARGNITSYTYDTFGRKASMTDPRGNATAASATPGWSDYTTYYIYDQADRLTEVRHAQGYHLAYDTGAIYARERTTIYGTPTATEQMKRELIARYTDYYQYDRRGNRIREQRGQYSSTSFGNTNLGEPTTRTQYDDLGRVRYTWVRISERVNGTVTTYEGQTERAYDKYGNLVSETDPEGRQKTWVYGAFGRLLYEKDPIENDGSGRRYTTSYEYDDYGRVIHEYDPNNATTGKSIWKTYDAAGRLIKIEDERTGVKTEYQYNLRGDRVREILDAPNFEGLNEDRDTTITFDALGRMTSWKDNLWKANLNIEYDADGNRLRTYTDAGYHPNGSSVVNTYRYVDNHYTYYPSGLLKSVTEKTMNNSGGALPDKVTSYDYDAANNRTRWTDGASNTTWTYTFDAANRVALGSASSGATQNWLYDSAGNVTNYTMTQPGQANTGYAQSYNEMGLVRMTNDGWDVYYDKAGRVKKKVLNSGGGVAPIEHTYAYYGDGREKSITASNGSTTGTSISEYNVNKQRTKVTLGRGNGDSVNDTSTFLVDNEGRILVKSHTFGNGQSEKPRYFYAAGNPVGETTIKNGVGVVALLDSGRYGAVQGFDGNNPGAQNAYTVQAGDTLSLVAGKVYGNPALWYVLADANGLTGTSTLREGQSLYIPNTVAGGQVTGANHAVYNEGNIVGSTLPNLRTAPPKVNKCAMISIIIVTVIVAIVVAVATYGAGTAASAAILGAGITAATATATIIAVAAIGAAIAGLGALARQGIAAAIDPSNHKFDRKFGKEFAGDFAMGALSGAAVGVGGIAGAAAKAGQLSTSMSYYARFASAGLEAAGAAVQQKIANGKITNWTGVATAAVSGYANASASIAQGAQTFASGMNTYAEGAGVLSRSQKTIADAVAFADEASMAAQGAKHLTTVTGFLSPWTSLHEQREEAERRGSGVAPQAWLEAVAKTLGSATASTVNLGSGFSNIEQELLAAGARTTSNLLTASAVQQLYGKGARNDFLLGALGSELGNAAGYFLGKGISSGFDTLEARANASPRSTDTMNRIYRGLLGERFSDFQLQMPTLGESVTGSYRSRLSLTSPEAEAPLSTASVRAIYRAWSNETDPTLYQRRVSLNLSSESRAVRGAVTMGEPWVAKSDAVQVRLSSGKRISIDEADARDDIDAYYMPDGTPVIKVSGGRWRDNDASDMWRGDRGMSLGDAFVSLMPRGVIRGFQSAVQGAADLATTFVDIGQGLGALGWYAATGEKISRGDITPYSSWGKTVLGAESLGEIAIASGLAALQYVNPAGRAGRALAAGGIGTLAYSIGDAAYRGDTDTLLEVGVGTTLGFLTSDYLSDALSQRLGRMMTRGYRATQQTSSVANAFLEGLDPVTRSLLTEIDGNLKERFPSAWSGIGPDTLLYRHMNPKYLDLDSMTVSGNPKSIALVQDRYDGNRRLVEASDLGAGLNVSPILSSDYKKSGAATIAIKLGDVLKNNGRFYADVDSVLPTTRPLYVTFDGAIPFALIDGPILSLLELNSGIKPTSNTGGAVARVVNDSMSSILDSSQGIAGLLPANAGPSHYFGNEVTLLNELGPWLAFDDMDGRLRASRDVSGDMTSSRWRGIVYGDPETSNVNSTYLSWKIEDGINYENDIRAWDPQLRAQGVTGQALVYSAAKRYTDSTGGYAFNEFWFSLGGNLEKGEGSTNFLDYHSREATDGRSTRTRTGNVLWNLGFRGIDVPKINSIHVRGKLTLSTPDRRFPAFRPFRFEDNWLSIDEINRRARLPSGPTNPGGGGSIAYIYDEFNGVPPGLLDQRLGVLGEVGPSVPGFEPRNRLISSVSSGMGMGGGGGRGFLPPEINFSDLVQPPLGFGLEKKVYIYGPNDKLAVGVYHPKTPRGNLDVMMASLNTLRATGYPVVRHFGSVNVSGKRGVWMEHIRDSLPFQDIFQELRFYPDVRPPMLTRQSIADVERIQNLIRRTQAPIEDLQLLVAPGGHTRIYDPRRIGTPGAMPENYRLSTYARNMSTLDSYLFFMRSRLP